MDWQQFAALGIVGVAAFLLLRSVLHRRKPGFSKDNPCGCSAVGINGSKASITVRSRKGELPQVIVKMP